MRKDQRHLRIVLSGLLIVYLVIAALMLVSISSIPSGTENFRKTLFIDLFLLLIIFIALFIIGYLSLHQNNRIDPNQIPIESAPENISTAPSATVGNIGGSRQGRLVKKMRHLMADVETSTLQKFGDSVLTSIAREFEFVQGLFYAREKDSDSFNVCGKYAWYSIESPADIQLGESLTGQAAKDGKMLHVPNVPENYVQVISGLGNASPDHLYIVPLMKNQETIGILELASFRELEPFAIQVLQALAEHLADILKELSIKTK